MRQPASGAGSSGVQYHPVPTADVEATQTWQPSTAAPSPTQEHTEYTQKMNLLAGICILFAFCAPFTLSMTGTLAVGFALTVSAFGFIASARIFEMVIRSPRGTPDMERIEMQIREASNGYMQTQFSSIAVFTACFASGLFVLLWTRGGDLRDVGGDAKGALAQAVAFVAGAACSALAGYSGLFVSVRANGRVAAAAYRGSTSSALLLAFQGGAASSILSASLCVGGISILYLTLHLLFVTFSGVAEEAIPLLCSGFSFGASLVALFMQLGGGIFTKAADIGADYVAKVEAGLKEDDPRNPAVIADLVGDNVGDCAGSMADVFESISAEVIGTMLLGADLAARSNLDANASAAFLFFPLIVHACDILVSTAGIYITKATSESERPISVLRRGYKITVILGFLLFVISARLLLYTPQYPMAWFWYSGCGAIGIVTGWLLVSVTQYYTDWDYEPVKRIARMSSSGHATNVIAGLGVGLVSTGGPALIIAACLLISYTMGSLSGMHEELAGVLGVAMSTMGMLSSAVFVLSMNNFGPIADNAGGIVEMSGCDARVRAITDELDAAGNVTKAATKGYAVGGSALAFVVLFQAFLDELQAAGHARVSIELNRVESLAAAVLGIATVFVFTGMAIDAVGRAAEAVVVEVRKELREPSVMSGERPPRYARVVAVVTRLALKQMAAPAMLALGAPIIIGFAFRAIGSLTGRPTLGVEAVGSFLVFTALTGVLLAVFLDNAGGAWDNAKKLVEKEGEGGTEKHKAAVTGDTVGDPCKDTAGPALHILVTSASTTALLFAPLFLGSAATAAGMA